MHFKPSSKLALREPLSDPRRNQEMTESLKILEVAKLAALKKFVTLYFLLQLEVK